jgi:hypothetical protein
MQMIRDGHTGRVLGGRVIERSSVGSRGRVLSCAVCTVHVKTRSVGFLVEPQNQGQRFVNGLTSKPAATVSSGLASKPAVMVSGGLRWFVSGFGLKICCDGFCRFGLKTCCDGFCRFGLKTCCDGFSVWVSKLAATVW